MFVGLARRSLKGRIRPVDGPGVDNAVPARALSRIAPAVLAVLLAAHLLAAVGVLALSQALSEGLYLCILGGAAGLCILRALRVDAERAPWLALGAGMVLWTTADIVYLELYGLNGQAPFPNPTDALYLSYYACFYVGVVLLMAARLRPFRRSLWLDGLVAGLTLAAFTAAFVFEPVLTSTSGDPLTVAVTLGYPVADLLLLCFVGVAFALTGWRPDRTWSLIGLSLVLTAVADGIYTYAASSDAYVAGRITDTLWAAAALAMGIAAWQPVAATRQQVRDTVAVVLPAVFALAALGLLISGWFSGLLPAAGVLATMGLLAAVARAGTTFAENVALLRSSRDEATTDALTGLGNRRLLLGDLGVALAEPGHELTLAFFDLDGFKRYNDSFGHVAGDALLGRLAGKLAASVAGVGRAYRLGGDEFCVILDPPARIDSAIVGAAARALAERGDAFAITASYGVAQLPREAATTERAMRLADERMYVHKESRRGAGKHQAHSVLVQVLVEREPELHQHLRDVALLVRQTAVAIGLESETLDEVVRAAELHDVGKIAVPDGVLHKPGPLDEDEWQIMRQHSVIGQRILATVPALRPVGLLVRSSHERWDGTGYPDRLSGLAIPLGARIIAVCDAFDAMTSARPYAAPLDAAPAIAELRRCAGTQFDPSVVDAFCAARSTAAFEPAPTTAPAR